VFQIHARKYSPGNSKIPGGYNILENTLLLKITTNHSYAKFQALIEVLMKIQVFWYVMPH